MNTLDLKTVKETDLLAYAECDEYFCLTHKNGARYVGTDKSILKSLSLITFDNKINDYTLLLNTYYDTSYELAKARLRLFSVNKNSPISYCVNESNIIMELAKAVRGNINAMYVFSSIYDIDCQNVKLTNAIEMVSDDFYFKKKPSKEFIFTPVPDLHFNSSVLKDVYTNILNNKVTIGNTIKSDYLPTQIQIGNMYYTLGFGGLHSNNGITVAYGNLVLLDVGSYYPSLVCFNKTLQNIINNSEFVNYFHHIYDKRMKAKEQNNNSLSHALKSVINAITGKFNQKYSKFYNPCAYLQMTITGQLLLLKLIEMLSENGIETITANTDGIIINDPLNKYSVIVKEWERMFNLKLSEKKLKFLYMENINNYFAISDDNIMKGCGCFNFEFKKNKSNNGMVIYLALKEYFLNDKQPSQYIETSVNKNLFIDIANVGDNTYRFYRSKTSHEPIIVNGRRIPNSDNCRLVHNDWLKDLDYNYYISETICKINDINKHIQK